jgi:hypothetical protein
MEVEVPPLDAHSARILRAVGTRVTVVDPDTRGVVQARAGPMAGASMDKLAASTAPGSGSGGGGGAQEGGFTYMVAVAFSVNYIMGTGFLTLPWAFSQTGYLSFFVVIIITLASVFAVHMVLESMARAELFRDSRRGHAAQGADYEELDVSTASNPLTSNPLTCSPLTSNPLTGQMSLDGSEGGGMDGDGGGGEGGGGVEPTICGFEDMSSSGRSDGGSVEDSNSGLYRVIKGYAAAFPDPEPGPISDASAPAGPADDAGEAEAEAETTYADSAADSRGSEAGGGLEAGRGGELAESAERDRNRNRGRGGDKDGAAEDEGAAPLPRVGERKFEVVEQCAMFLGPALQGTYMLFLCCYMFGTLWAYGTVFANALASNLPIPNANSYLLYLLLFGCIVVPISCMELEEQIAIQVVLSLGRVLMVLLMVSSILISCVGGGEGDFGTEMQGGGGTVPFNLGGIHHLLPIAAFAHIFHHSVPALSAPVVDKTQLASIFSATLLLCFLAYSAIALSVSLFFGDKTMTSSNLNWVHYGHNSFGFSYFIKRVVATFVVMFPGLDVASAFPLNAVTLGNNLFSVVYGKKVHTMGDSKRHRIVFRLLGAIPPLVMAAIVSDLGQITDYTGVTGFGIAFIFPPMLSYFSFVKLRDKGLSTPTLYSNFSTTPGVCLALFSLGVFLCIYVPVALS